MDDQQFKMFEKAGEAMAALEHRIDVQHMISTILLGFITSELEVINPDIHNKLHAVLDNTHSAVSGNHVAEEAIDAIRLMLG